MSSDSGNNPRVAPETDEVPVAETPDEVNEASVQAEEESAAASLPEPENSVEASEMPTEVAKPVSSPEASAGDSEEAGEEEHPAEELTPAGMEELIDQYSGDGAPVTGEICSATVVNVTGDGVVVDLGMKSEGLVPLAEFAGEDGQTNIEPGASIEVLLEGSQPREGYIPCSSEGAHRQKLWAEVEGAYRERRKLRCHVVKRVKGGLEVEINLPGAHPGRRPLTAFLPGSQVDLKPVRYWDGLLNRDLDCRVLKLNRRRGNLVVCRRVILEEEQAQRRKLLDEVLKEGVVLKGTVKNLTNYGAFIDLGGLDGLLHITDLSYRRLGHPSEAVSPGDEVEVKVLKVDKEKERVSLGMKQLETDPWQDVEKKYPAGERVRGRVTRLMDYGAFVELEPGVEGLIHVSEMSWTKRVRHPKEILKQGDWVEAAVLDVQFKEQRISLGLRQTQADPFQRATTRYPVGSVVKGKVRSLTDFGAFIELEPGVEGLVHKTELSWEKKGKRPSELLKRGQEVDAKVLKVDPGNRRLSLSLKDLQPDPWAAYIRNVREGESVHGRVVRRANFGFFVELAPGVEGLCHVSEVPEDDQESVTVNSEHDFKILKLNPTERRISLSLKEGMDRRALAQYRSEQPRSTATLKEILSAKRQSAGLEGSG